MCSCPCGSCVHSHHAEHPACRSSEPAVARSSLLCSISVCVESLQGKRKIELGRYVLVCIFVSEPMSAGVCTHTQPCHPRMCTHTLCPTCARTHTHTLCPTGDLCTASAISCSTRDLSLRPAECGTREIVMKPGFALQLLHKCHLLRNLVFLFVTVLLSYNSYVIKSVFSKYTVQ